MDKLKPPESVHFDAGNVAETWRRWEQQFRVYMTATELSRKTKATRVAILHITVYLHVNALLL